VGSRRGEDAALKFLGYSIGGTIAGEGVKGGGLGTALALGSRAISSGATYLAGLFDDSTNEAQPGAARASAPDERLVRGLVEREQRRVAKLDVGPDTLVDKQTLGWFDAAARIKTGLTQSTLPEGVMQMFNRGASALDERITLGGYGNYDGPISEEDSRTIVRLSPLAEGEVAAVKEAVDNYYKAYGNDPARRSTTNEVAQFADSWAGLSENQRGYVAATIVNGAVTSPKYMDWYSTIGYERDLDRTGLGDAMTPLELIDPRSLLRLGMSAVRGTLSLASRTGIQDLMRSIVAGTTERAELDSFGRFLKPGAAAIRQGPVYIPGEGYVPRIEPRPNTEIYGSAAVPRTTGDIPSIMQKAGYSAEELEGFRFKVLSADEYASDVAARGGKAFDARYGPNTIEDTATYTYAKSIIRGAADEPATIFLRPGLLESDEALVQTVAHEMSEMGVLATRMKALTSGKQYWEWVRPDRQGNLHYDAVVAGDAALLRFREALRNSGQ